ncbi:hypothetical protein AB3S75_015721 [Citrus x aurantiifolia]
MVDAIVSSLLEQLISVAADEVKQHVRLVTGVREEVKKLTSNLRAIRAVLEDAEKRQMQRDNTVTFWLDQLKDASYDMEDVLEEWTTARLKLQIEAVDDDNALALAPHKKKELTIHICPLLENRYREGKGEDWHKISHIPHIKW